ncbi:MAG: dicarboxylate/amino acid:cation symporter [Oscillospiraceae bacterium]|nr:dicarboxylate/amino acid:cation symporter [Oscillospiraceae bacterium]
MKAFLKNYGAVLCMLAAIVAGCIVGAVWPGATVLKPLGTLFINMMFCIVVPMVFASIAGAVANMGNRKRAGKIMGVTIGTFVVTGAIAALIMYLVMQVFPPVLQPWTELPSEEMGEYASISQLIVNFFTAEDFVGLLSRRAMLPLIVFSVLFGFAVNLNGGKESTMGKWLEDLSNVMMKFVKLISYYAPIAFFGFFADLVATYGPKITADYGRAMVAYYPLCFIYVFTAFPLFALIGGGKDGPREMFRHILKPAMVSLGTCSSVATIPTNMEAAKETGISKDVSDIVLPLGATMHMDGSCFSCVLKIAFVFGVFGKPFGLDMLIPVILVAVLSSVGMSGVPGGGYIGEYIICSIFFPEQIALAFPILVTIGNLVDPPATMINAAGDYVVSFIVSRFVDGKNWLRDHLLAKK